MILDYVCEESQGTAISFGLMGLSIGIITSLNVLFEFTKDLDPIYSWSAISILSILFAFVLAFMISEPNRKKINDKKEPVITQMKMLTVKLFEATKNNPNLLIGWLFLIPANAPMSILTIYLISWL